MLRPSTIDRPADFSALLTAWRVGWPARGGFHAGDTAVLSALHAAWLAHVPFENVTKREAGRPRRPEIFWRDHLARGSGGTCYDATAACRALLEAAGFSARPVFCRLPAGGPTGHAALLVELAGGAALVDVGYALPLPVPLPDGERRRIATPWYDVEILRGPGREFLLFTSDSRGRRFRYSFTDTPVTPAEFTAAWLATCAPGARYMGALALGRFRPGHRLIYAAPNLVYELSRDRQLVERLDDPMAETLARRFELPPRLVAAGQIESDPAAVWLGIRGGVRGGQ